MEIFLKMNEKTATTIYSENKKKKKEQATAVPFNWFYSNDTQKMKTSQIKRMRLCIPEKHRWI